MSLFGCLGAKKYNVDCQKKEFLGIKDSYRAGAKVRVKIPLATDTDYSFYVDGESISPEYSSNGGELIYTFTMPDHDVTVDFSMRNSMIIDTPEIEDDEADTETLFSYCSMPCAVVGEYSYDLISLCTDGNGGFLVDVYTYTGSESGCEVTEHKSYRTTEDTLTELNGIADEYGMDSWNELPDEPMDGGSTSVSFLDKLGEKVTVTTDRMPENGGEAFGKISSILWGCVKEENREG